MEQITQLTVFGISEAAKLDFEAIGNALQSAHFHPGSALAEKTTGWTAPRDEQESPLLESIAGHWLAKFVIESRSVPKDAVDKKMDLAVEAYEQEHGRSPGRKARREMRDDVRASLLPDAFPKTEEIWVWIDPTAHTVGISATAQSKTDEVVTGLVRAIEDFSIEHRTDQGEIATAMREWLLQEDDEAMPADITLGTECVLRAQDESKAVAQFNKQSLSCEEVRQSLKAGKMPVRVELAFGDRLSLVLCSSGALKKIKFKESFLFDRRNGMDDPHDIEGSFTIFATEMGKTLTELKNAVSMTAERATLAHEASQRAMQGVAVMWARQGEGQPMAAAA